MIKNAITGLGDQPLPLGVASDEDATGGGAPARDDDASTAQDDKARAAWDDEGGRLAGQKRTHQTVEGHRAAVSPPDPRRWP